MSSSIATVKLDSRLITSDSTPVYHYLPVPKDAVKHFAFKGNLRRVICTLNESETFNCALFPSRENYLISLNKKMRDRLGIAVGDNVRLTLEKDESKYGMPMPEEFAEVLRQDPDGDRLFNELSPGNQRIMLQLVVYVKDVDRRIARALAGIELLKRSEGKFDYRIQHDSMRLASSAQPSTALD